MKTLVKSILAAMIVGLIIYSCTSKTESSSVIDTVKVDTLNVSSTVDTLSAPADTLAK